MSKKTHWTQTPEGKIKLAAIRKKEVPNRSAERETINNWLVSPERLTEELAAKISELRAEINSRSEEVDRLESEVAKLEGLRRQFGDKIAA